MKTLPFVVGAAAWLAPMIAQAATPKPIFATGTAIQTATVSEEGNFKVFPVAGPLYNPEWDLMIFGGGIFSFRTDPSDPDLNRSTLLAGGGYSTNGSLFVGVDLASFWVHGLLRINAGLGIKNMPDHYWGVGYDAGRSTPKGDSTLYQKGWWELKTQMLLRVRENLYAGGDIVINGTKATDVNPQMAMDPYYIEGGSQNLLMGFGPMIQWDSRDVPANAWEGFFAQAIARFYGPFGVSDKDFQIIELDYRHYVPLFGLARTLAWQVWTRTSFNDIPWHEMPSLGWPPAFRGYFQGQYRDKTVAFAVLEYRHMFHNGRFSGQDGSPGGDNAFEWIKNRSGFVVWGGAGSLGDEYVDMKNWLPTYGGGYRFLLFGRLHLRADVAGGLDSAGFYLGVNEAF